MAAGQPITVVKLDHTGKLVTSYTGQITRRNARSIVLEARWQRPRLELPYVTFDTGDQMIESFFMDRWYSIFEIHSGLDTRLKGWYCNISRPAVLAGDTLSAIDLALDVFVHPDGRFETLDQDEFEALNLSQLDPNAYRQALAAVAELRSLVESRRTPFETLPGPNPR